MIFQYFTTSWCFPSIAKLMERCGRINQKKAAQQYVESLRQRRKMGTPWISTDTLSENPMCWSIIFSETTHGPPWCWKLLKALKALISGWVMSSTGWNSVQTHRDVSAQRSLHKWTAVDVKRWCFLSRGGKKYPVKCKSACVCSDVQFGLMLK